MSLHIAAKKGDIAEKILLPGDPKRAKYMAETFLDNPKEYTNIRNILGFTGTYKGTRVSIQGTGMGMPSMAIYVHELICDYKVQKLIRVGTCGALQKNINVRNIVMAMATTTDTSMVRTPFSPLMNFSPIANFTLLEKAVNVARKLKIPFHVGNVLSQDNLYDDDLDLKKLASYGILSAEMESAALYLLAAKYKVDALAIFTVSNHLLTGAEISAEERELSLADMAKIALDTIIQ